MKEKVTVGLGEYVVANSPTILQAIGLGSCVAVCVYDKSSKIGGLSHVFLPSSKRMKVYVNPLRFADLAIPAMLKDMEGKGCLDMSAKIFGGSSMFPTVKSIMGIGQRNIDAVKKVLESKRIRIIGEDVGGVGGRSVLFTTDDGSVTITHTKGTTTKI